VFLLAVVRETVYNLGFSRLEFYLAVFDDYQGD